MPASSTRSAATGLTLETIVDASCAIVAEDGFEALSMRRLATRLGVGAMTLYGYVRTKEELLSELANRFISEIELPQQTGSWQEQIRQVYRSVRQVFVEHPELLPIVASQRLEGVGVYRGAERVFAALRGAGLDGEQAVAAFDALTSFTIGMAERETGIRPQGGLPGIRTLPHEEFPNVIELAGQLMTRDSERSFEAGLELILRGIETQAQS
jgi:AcrR family transcriptional regulator